MSNLDAVQTVLAAKSDALGQQIQTAISKEIT